MRRRDSRTTDAGVARELAAIDAALAGAAVEPDLADLAELALTLRDDRPPAEAAFAARLDAQVAAGFPAASAASHPGRRRRWAGAGALAAAAAAAVVAIGIAGSDEQLARPARDATGAAQATAGLSEATDAVKTAPPVPGAPNALGFGSAATPAAPGATPVPPVGAKRSFSATATGGSATFAQTVDRSVERGASLRLATSPAKLDDVAAGVVRVTDALGGFVMTSSVDARSGGGGAAFDLRIPSDRLSQGMAQLSQLGHVRSRTQTTADITSAVSGTRSRIAGLRSARRRLLAELAAGPAPADAAILRARLRSVDRRLAAARRAQADLARRVAYAAVAVEIVTERHAAAAGGGRWTLGDAAHDAGRVLALVAGALLVGVAAALPLALLGLLAWALVRTVRRRGREHALDAG